jgi:hypothetical protein
MTAIEELLGAIFSMLSVAGLYGRVKTGKDLSTEAEFSFV